MKCLSFSAVLRQTQNQLQILALGDDPRGGGVAGGGGGEFKLHFEPVTPKIFGIDLANLGRELSVECTLWGTPIYGLYRNVLLDSVWFSACLS